jgi:CxxC motif-containing protein (DUF1111 family)
VGDGLADGLTLGLAGGLPQARRSGVVGKRIFFLHDGRTSDIVEAIRQHASRGSQANNVISGFETLSVFDRQAIVDFLRSLKER